MYRFNIKVDPDIVNDVCLNENTVIEAFFDDGNIIVRILDDEEAERIEDNWAEPFWAVHELDLSDATIEVYRDETQFLFVEIKDGEIMFRGEFSETTETGVLTQEIAYSMDSDNTHRLLVQLRLKNGTRNKLSTVFKKEFGTEAGAESFATFCKDHSIEYTPLRVI